MSQSICLLILVLAFLLGLPVCSVLASPLVVLDNNTGPITVGGSALSDTEWRAVIFTTPLSAGAEIVSIDVGLNCYLNPSTQCTGYPTTRQLQIDLYSVVGGQPSSALYSLPLQGVYMATQSQIYTFSIPNWTLAANTSYALVLKSVSSDSQRLKWAGLVNNTVPTGLNGFSYVGTSYIAPPATPAWIASPTTDQVVVIHANINASVPTLSEWAQLMLALMVIGVAWHFHSIRLSA